MNIRIIPFIAAIALLASCAGLPPMDEGDFEMETVALYNVENSELTPGQNEGEEYMELSPGNLALHQSLWDRARAVIPDEYESYIKHFRISSDGVDNIMAYVEASETESETDLSSWTLAVDILDVIDRRGEAKLKEMDETLIHEFGHILSFNSGQADPVPLEDMEDESWMENWDFSDRYRSYDAVSHKDSYLNLFFQEFWGTERLEEWLNLESEDLSEEDYYAAMNRMSIKYHTDFVSDYAMTNAEEDFAESFTRFVMEEDQDESEFLSGRKVNFFYRFPELREMRLEMRKNLSLDDREA